MLKYKTYQKQKKYSKYTEDIVKKMIQLSHYLSLITLNVNTLNSTVRFQLAELIKRQDPKYVAYKKCTSSVKTHT